MDLPTAWNIEYRRNLLRLNSDRLIMTYTDLGGIEYCAAIRANHPIPEQCGLFYFEVDIINKGENGMFEIGIGFCTQAASLNRLPASSWGYHGDDGKRFFNDTVGKPYGSKFMTGDTIGCCIKFRNNTAFYTRNGALHSEILKKALYPCVGLMSPGGSVGANFGYRNDYIDEFLKNNWAEILNPNNDKLISQQINRFSRSLEIKKNVLKYQGKLYFVIGEYEQALADLTKLLEFETQYICIKISSRNLLYD
ncbi:5764_t:CDS:2 [Funneliformis mosseae]|uniref:5764_t:CDS:1 n=1 Tax=Funneliformis mosseae TaxID=27381 RepID=A0A9N9A4U9_FUNMO|nr:5764_t:CDS:2 [Funneliformis mosseae]